MGLNGRRRRSGGARGPSRREPSRRRASTRRRTCRAGLASLAALFVCAPAVSQELQPELSLRLSSGLEAADIGNGVGWQRARTRLGVGLNLGVDEAAYLDWGARAFVELERSLAFGGEVGVSETLGDSVSVFGGAAFVLVPSTLLGVTGQATYHIRLSERFSLGIVLNLSVLPLGSDRPAKGPVFWSLLGVQLSGRP